ncbi:tetratricopeptide repeat protein [Maribacter sp. 2210JD10-5]|uniref:tetratricopeptide repeat-containing sensor histidine kinase n=1 Tax=Maribacter sp. 2210JD10-5 TaxID=3386272 RepID=UPI0039BC2D10
MKRTIYFISFRTPQRNILLLGLLFLFGLFSNAQTQNIEDVRSRILEIKAQKDFNEKDTTYIELLDRLCYEYSYYDTDTLLHYTKKGLNLSKQANYTYGVSRFLFNYGQYFSFSGESDKALEHYKKALKIAKDINSYELIANIQNGIGLQYSMRGEKAKALDVYLSSIEVAEKLEDKVLLSVITENIASLYADQNDYTNALSWYEQVENINQKIGDEIIIAETSCNVASIYNEIKDYEKALENINRAIKTFEKEKIYDWLAFSYGIKASIYLKQKKYKWSKHWLEQGISLHEKLDDENGKMILLHGLSEVYLDEEEKEISKEYATKAYDIANKLKNLEGQKNCAEILYKIEKSINNSKAALHYHEIFKKLSDSITVDDSRKNLSMLKAKMDYEKQKEGLILENEKALAQQRNYIYAFITIAILLLGILLYRRKTIRYQKKLNKRLLSKQRDLKKNRKHLRKVIKTKNTLFSIIGHDLRGPIGALQGLLDMFKQGQIEEKELIGFLPKMKNDVDNIAFTLNNLLSWGQTQMKADVNKPKNVNLGAIFEKNISLLSEIALRKNIKIVNKVKKNTIAWSDENQIDVVVRNLISNAIKFTPENGKIVVGAVEKTKSWEVFVRDNGVGMDSETMTKIFNKDSNHTTYGTNDEKGTGLGLSLCKEMVETNKGIIWADSALDKGSSFYFTVPKVKNKTGADVEEKLKQSA